MSDTFTVIVSDVNDIPQIINPIDDIVVDEDALDTIIADLKNVFFDIEDGVNITFEVFSDNSDILSASIDNSGLLSLNFSRDAHGESELYILATDRQYSVIKDSVTVTVNSVNDAPVLLGVIPWVMEKNIPVTLTNAQFVASDVDNDLLTMNIMPGDNYTIEGLTVTTTRDYVGTLTVPVNVTDGIDMSNTMEVLVEVREAGENRAPILTGASIPPIEKNTSLRVRSEYLTTVDYDFDSLTVYIWEGENYTVHGSKIIPDDDFVGKLEVSLQVTDGIDLSEVITTEVSVFEEVVGFYKGQVLKSDTYVVVIGPNPVPPGANQITINAVNEESDELEIKIFNETANLVHSGSTFSTDGHFEYVWYLNGTVERGRSYVVFMTYYQDNIAVETDRRMIGISR